MTTMQTGNTYLVGTTEEEVQILSRLERLKQSKRIVDPRPDSLPAICYRRRADSKKWYICITMRDNRPYEIFVMSNARDATGVIQDAQDRVIKLAERYGIHQDFIDDQMDKSKHQANSARLSRLISLCLRHDVPVLEVVRTLDEVEHNVSNLSWHLSKLLAMHIPQNAVKNSTCPNCGQEAMRYQSGCKMCMECGWERC